MSKNVSHVRNPLTVISIFAGIAEISGTGVLPFIAAENQAIYVWFLMLFPAFLVTVFFLTLNFNHRVLYAPSDYRDEKNFVNPYGNASPEEQDRKLRREVAEIEESQSDETRETPADQPKPDASAEEKAFVEAFDKRRQLIAEVTLAEKLAINKLSKDIAVDFSREVRVEGPNGQVAFFDALGTKDDEIHAVEVKLLKSKRTSVRTYTNALRQAELAAQTLSRSDPRKFTLHFMAVIDSPAIEVEHFKNEFNSFAQDFAVNVQFHSTTLHELQSGYQ